MLNVRIFGIKIRISYMFLLAVTLLLLTDRTGLMTASLLSIIIHESAHLLAIKILKIKCDSVELMYSTLRINSDINTDNKKSLAVILSGPMINFLLSPLALAENEYIKYFGISSLIVGVFNIIPAKGLDGGDALYHLLRALKIKNPNVVYSLISYFSIGIIIFLGGVLILFMRSNPSLLIVGVYLLIMSFYKI